MDAYEIIRIIRESQKQTPVKAYVKAKRPLSFEGCKVFGAGDQIVFGDWKDVQPALEQNAADIEELVVENDRRNSAIPLLDLKRFNARIGPGAIIRDQVEIGDGAVIACKAVTSGAAQEAALEDDLIKVLAACEGIPVETGSAVGVLTDGPGVVLNGTTGFQPLPEISDGFGPEQLSEIDGFRFLHVLPDLSENQQIGGNSD